MDKKSLTEQDIRSKFISPAILAAGWDSLRQLREEVQLTKGRVIVKGKLSTRAEAKRAAFVLYLRQNLPIAVVEAKDNNCGVGTGMQQALGYARLVDVPFAFSSNGDAFLSTTRAARARRLSRSAPSTPFPRPTSSGVAGARGPLDAYITAEYLLRYILSDVFLSMAVKNDTRVAMPKINQGELARVLVAVPPLREQDRIVAKVRELTSLCDALESRLTHAREKSAHLAASVVHHLTAA